MKSNRIIAFLLVLFMVASLYPLSVFAESDIYQLTVDGTVTVDGSTDQTVNVYFQSIATQKTYSLEAVWSKNETDGTNHLTLTGLTAPSGVTPMENNVSTGKVYWTDTSFSAPVITEAGGTVWTATYVVDANTPSGTYTVSLTGKATDSNYNTIDFGELTATITVTNTAGSDDDEGNSGSEITTAPYTVELKTDDTEVKVGDEITVDILVGGTTGEFASSELELTYEGLTYDSANSTTNGADITAAGGTIKIIDHGETTTWTEGTVTAYTLKFTVNAIDGATGIAKVTLNSAALSTAANAKENDLTPATITVAEKNFAVTPADLSVEMPEGFTSDAIGNKVEYDGTITIEATNKNYIYKLTATGGTIIDNQDGTWTITNVTEDVTVTFVENPVPKTYTITFNNLSHLKQVNGATPENSVVNFTYNPDATFSFVLKDNVPASTTSGMTYAVESISYAVGGNVTFAPPTTETDRTYTISGADITGNIVITTSAETVDPDQFTVKLPTGYDNELTADKTVVDNGDPVVLTLTPEAGYKYTIKYTMGNNAEVTLAAGANAGATYTISNITANVTITVTKEFDETSVEVTVDKYLELDGSDIYLVTVVGNQKYSYDGAAMFYSAKYNNAQGAYVYLVKANANATLTAEAVRGKIALTTDIAIVIDYTGDVNNTEKVDANDAQLVWNIYSDKLYSNFDALPMETFLRADVDGNGAVNMDDAAEIVRIIKTQN